MQAEIDQCILFWVFMTNLKVSRKFYGTRGLKYIDHFHYSLIKNARKSSIICPFYQSKILNF